MSRKTEESNFQPFIQRTIVVLLVTTMTYGGVSGQRTKVQNGTINPSQRTLICVFTDVTDRSINLPNSIFYLNGEDVRTKLKEGSYTEQRGRITFPLTQELEGEYTCNNGTTFPVESSLEVFALPVPDDSIKRYYVRPVGGSVSMSCGIRQGRLERFYRARWLINQLNNAENMYRERANVRREDLEDYTLTIQPLLLTDTNTYVCRVEVGRSNDPPTGLGSQEISLLVFQHPDIQFLSDDQLHIVHSNNKSSLSPIVFTCNASGAPDLKVHWKHNENIITDGDSFTIVTQTNTTQGLTLALSQLQINNPSLANSGNITCFVSIEYLPEDAASSVPSQRSISRSRNLTVLDSSLEPRPYATQDEDLLLRMDVPDGVTIPGVTQIRLKITPNEDPNSPLITPVDDVFFEGSRFYAFVPASQLQTHRRFHVQVALVVDGQTGPFSPESVTDLQFIDIDEVSTCNHFIYGILGLGAALLCLVVIVLVIAVTYCYKKRSDAKVIDRQASAQEQAKVVEHNENILEDRQDQQRAWDVILEKAKQTLEEERQKCPRNEKMIADMMCIVTDIFKNRLMALWNEQKDREKVVSISRRRRGRGRRSARAAPPHETISLPSTTPGEIELIAARGGEEGGGAGEGGGEGGGGRGTDQQGRDGATGNGPVPISMGRVDCHIRSEGPTPLEDFEEEEEESSAEELTIEGEIQQMKNKEIDDMIAKIDSILYKTHM